MEHWWQTFFDRTVAQLILAQPRAHELEFLVRELELAPGSLLFDQCCGWGRVAGPLSQRGVRVYGVDSNSDMISEARARWNGSVKFALGDAAEFRQSPLCDAACNLYSSFGYSPDHDYNQHIINVLVSSVREGGRLLLDTINPRRVFDHFQPVMVGSLACGGEVRRHSTILERGKLLSQRWEFMPLGQPPFERSGDTWLYSAEELAAMLERAGCEPLKSLGCLQSSPYTATSERLIWVAVR